jgi:uncharacterized membrane protein (DUF4010 family)
MDLSSLKQFSNTVEFKFLLSLLVGFLIGFEREIRGKLGQDVFAGIRTFPMIAVLGTISAMISQLYAPYFLYISYLGLIALSAVNYWLGVQKRTGITTEVAVFLTYTLGVLIYFGYYYEVVFFTVVITFLLATKRILESFARIWEVEDILFLLQFLAITILVYPLLPDREVIKGLNPSELWKFIILVSLISFISYFLLKYYLKTGGTKGIKKSLYATAILGGSVSSTAVTISFSRLSKTFPQLTYVLFVGISVAWAVMIVRVWILLSLVFPGLVIPTFKVLFPLLVLTLLVALYYFKRTLKSEMENLETTGEIKFKNPFSWSEIFQFALIYSLVAVSAEYLKTYFGDLGIFLVSFLSGLIDVDSITLALSKLSSVGSISLSVAVWGITTAIVSNNFFKSIYAFIFGHREIWKPVAILLGTNLVYLLLLGVFYLV